MWTFGQISHNLSVLGHLPTSSCKRDSFLWWNQNVKLSKWAILKRPNQILTSVNLPTVLLHTWQFLDSTTRDFATSPLLPKSLFGASSTSPKDHPGKNISIGTACQKSQSRRQEYLRQRRILLLWLRREYEMNGWVCVPNMGASISGLGLKLPPDPLPFLTTAQGSKLAHSPNWNPLQAIGGHDSPGLNTGGRVGGSAHQGPEYPCEVVLSAGQCSQYTWSTAQNLARGSFWSQFSYLGPTLGPCKLPIRPTKEKNHDILTYFNLFWKKSIICNVERTMQ